MIAHSDEFLCKQASLYYYSLLSDDRREDIPEFMVKHVENCKNCQSQLKGLKDALSKTGDSSSVDMEKADAGIAMMLKLHFKYIGKEVTCETVKPFLPTLVEPSMKVKIPTPITVHLDKCQQCSDDLETIRSLGLSLKQLRRLSLLFAETSSSDRTSCPETQDAILAVLAAALMDFENTNEDALKHICICPECRNKLYQHRDSVIKELLHNNTGQEQFCYQDMPQADIFDYVLPYGLDPATDQYAKFRQSITSHLRICPTCLTKMQKLHNTIYAIAERNESEVVTIYHIDKSAKTKAINEFDVLYSGFPIRVEVAKYGEAIEAKEQSPTINLINVLKNKMSGKNVKPLFKAAIVAAVILIGFMFLFNIPTAKAVTIEQVYRAIEKVKNVYISKFVKNQSEPVEERWISKNLGIYAAKTAKNIAIWDTRNGEKRSKDYQSGSTEITKLTSDEISSIEKRMSGSLGLMPFENMQDIPPDAKWYQTESKILKTDEKVEVYNLEWVEYAYDGSPVFKKWIVNINSVTKLPERIGCYTRTEQDKDYLLENIVEVKYISQNGVQEVLNKFAF